MARRGRQSRQSQRVTDPAGSAAAGLPPHVIAAAFLAACAAELEALKPGNVHRHAAGHRMTVADFAAAAAAAAPRIAAPGATVGQRVLAATEASLAATGQNVNLGIVLLCAPLGVAAEHGVPVAQVLAALTVEDAALAFRAIAAARPGGLGDAPHDVRAPARITLAEAMRLAAPRDGVARAYASGFAEVLADAGTDAGAIYLRLLARRADTHVARKFGLPVAESVRAEAAALGPQPSHTALLAFDASLKARGLNPGTTADLTVASLFAAALASHGAKF